MSFSIATRLPRSILSSAYGFGALVGVFSCFSNVFFWSLVGEELELELEPALTATDELELESTFAAADELELESTLELDLEPAFVSDELELELAFAAEDELELELALTLELALAAAARAS